ncbi:hypothetical protein CEXT_456811, partial [Caerostris extrusa]
MQLCNATTNNQVICGDTEADILSENTGG